MSIQRIRAILGRRATAFAAVAAVAALGSSLSAATYRFDNNGGDGLWETSNNWLESVGSTHGTLPGPSDVAEISSSFTASISSSQSISELFVQAPNNSPSNTPGIATLNILAGTTLLDGSTNGARIGRALQSGQLPGSSTGVVNQSGGTFTITSGTNGLRLSQADSGNVANSLYAISGGSVRGGSTNGSMTAPLQVGNIANNFTRAEFRMVGSGVTEARFEDVRLAGGAAGPSVLKFVLDAAGVTPLTAEDELRFIGTNSNLLEIELSDYAPLADITLITADRLTTASSAPAETFTGLADGAAISAVYGTTQYNWTVDYQDGSDNGVLDAYVKLVFVNTQPVPEPASLSMLAIGAAAMLRRRRA